ncbi:uncharacterized protein N7496_010455 [Penicillium cataractarum]|uniref:Uncharacterized protein n=1 Tax=Penicillium cataractarum TaxID=2100454 RepID=A0A9W9RR45_9EURO|nr:uncharacterized protein N7496_010455 [Penicillium cataractarum]KAJ5364742.1 hypothetical protein N7496_010455 [Penicillium cataractarum]
MVGGAHCMSLSKRTNFQVPPCADPTVWLRILHGARESFLNGNSEPSALPSTPHRAIGSDPSILPLPSPGDQLLHDKINITTSYLFHLSSSQRIPSTPILTPQPGATTNNGPPPPPHNASST